MQLGKQVGKLYIYLLFYFPPKNQVKCDKMWIILRICVSVMIKSLKVKKKIFQSIFKKSMWFHPLLECNPDILFQDRLLISPQKCIEIVSKKELPN